jgi:hypothetical protein
MGKIGRCGYVLVGDGVESYWEIQRGRKCSMSTLHISFSLHVFCMGLVDVAETKRKARNRWQ